MDFRKFTLSTKVKKIFKITVIVLCICLIITGIIYNKAGKKNTIIEELTNQASEQGLENVVVTIIEKNNEYDWYNVSIYASNLDSFSYKELFEIGHHIYSDDAFIVNFKSDNNIYVVFSDCIYKNGKEVWEKANTSVGINGECALSYCNFKAKPGKAYCSRHGCCKEDCNKQKDPMVHCCNVHNCAAEGCGQHRYDYKNSRYCQTHYVHYYSQ